jgi:hypothetical protein
MPLAYPRLRGFPSANLAGNIPCSRTTPLFEFSLRLEPPATIPSRPNRSRSDSSRGLCFPTAHEDSEVHLTRVLPARYVPPSGFDYPLGGFLPHEPLSVLFHTDGAPGIHPSKRSPLGKYSRRYRPNEPTYRFTLRCTDRRSDRPVRKAPVPGSLPARASLAAKHVVSASATGCSLGFLPF